MKNFHALCFHLLLSFIHVRNQKVFHLYVYIYVFCFLTYAQLCEGENRNIIEEDERKENLIDVLCHKIKTYRV